MNKGYAIFLFSVLIFNFQFSIFNRLELVDRAAHDAPLRGFDEIEDQIALFARFVFRFDGLDGVGIVQAARVERAVNILDEKYLLVREATTAQPDDVDAAIGDRVAADERVGRDVLPDARTALDHHMLRDAGKLVHQRAAADDGIVVDFDLARQLGRIPDDDIILQDTIVRHVRIGHNEAVAPDDRPPLRGRAAVDRHALAERRIVSDFSCRNLPFELQVLRNARDDGAREDAAVIAQPRPVEDNRVRVNVAIIANDHVLFDDGKRLDRHILAQFRCWIHDG